MPGFNIRNASSNKHLQVFVSKYSEDGDDSWFNVPTSFADPKTAHWERNGWELVAFRDTTNETRRGWYLNCTNQTVDVTFNGFDKEITIARH